MPLRELRIADLAAAYRTVTYEEAVEMANLGAAAYEIVRDSLRQQWETAMGAEEAAKADIWRSEGRIAALSDFKPKLKEMEALSVRLAAAEAANEQQMQTIEKEVSLRVSNQLDGFRKDYELAKVKEMEVLHGEISALKQEVAAAKARDKYVHAIEEANALMREKLVELEERTKVKTSTQIGKEGEAEIMDMLEGVVCKEFEHASVKNMAGISHMGDFHLSVMGANGQRIKIIIDSKKYVKSVPLAEIEKLNRDVDADEEASAGMMVSHTSGICSMKNFKIGRTTRNRPVLYISFQHMEDAIKPQVLCWGVRTLQAIAMEQNMEEQLRRLEEINEFLNGIDASVVEFDGAIRKQVQALDAMKWARTKLVSKLTEFRSNRSAAESTIQLEEESTGGATGSCSAVLKKTGSLCGRAVVEGSSRCGVHAERKR
jgi:polyhydroxyalkanoate synthesis regulator phasin